MIGIQVSHYKILDALGSGGMGVLYRAEDVRLRRPVVLKFLPARLAQDPEMLERFRREAWAASALDHPNICAVYDIGEHEGQPFIVLPLLEGRTLKQRLGEGPLTSEEIVRLGIQIASGLEAAHERGILHRDLKPANIFVNQEGLAKILDFGLAKQVDAEAESSSAASTLQPERETELTTAGATPGTLTYMSPEQVRGQDLDARSDLFSLGVTLYEMATGTPPFRGGGPTAIASQILEKTPAPPSDMAPDLRPELERIIEKALEKAPDRRYQSAGDLRADLERLAGEGQTGLPSFLAGWRSARRRLNPSIPWLAAAFLAVVVALGALFWSGTSPPTSDAPGPPGSVAVLPFSNLSKEPDSSYFSDGLTDSIITQLSKIRGLTVISRTSSEQYRTRDKNLRQIARELRAANVLEGSVQREKEQVRIRARLVDAAVDRNLWADSYERELSSIFAIQEEVALKIAAALRVQLSSEEVERIEQRPTSSLSAYDFYLKGLEYYRRFRQEDNEKAVELFEKSLLLDADFALARAGLADAYFQRWQRFGYSADWIASSRREAERAAASNPKLAEAYKSLGNAYWAQGSFQKAIEATRKAAELSPNYADAVNNVGVYLSVAGQMDEALRWVKKASRLDPLSADGYATVGAALYYLGWDEEAEEWLGRALELEPDNVLAHYNLGEMRLLQARDEKALEQARRILARSPDEASGQILAAAALRFQGKESEAALQLQKSLDATLDYHNNRVSLGHILWRQGRRQQARQVWEPVLAEAREAVKAGSESPYPRYFLAQVHSAMGNLVEAQRWLEDATAHGWIHQRWSQRDPLLGNLRGHSQFQETMRSLQSVVQEQRQRAKAATDNGN